MMYCKCRRHLSFDILLFLAICIGGNTPLWAQSRLDSIQQLDEVVVTAKSYKEVIPAQKMDKLTLMKTLAIFFQNIKFCKAQNWVNFRNILYLSHILVGEFPPFWLPNLIFGGIPKDTKKPTNSKGFVYELVG